MILVNEIRGRIKAKGFTQDKLAKALGMSPKTLGNKLRKGVFGSDEIEKMINILEIKNPLEVFFNDQVT